MATLTGYLRDSKGIYIDKDPDAILDYTLNWTNYTQDSDAIATATWSVSVISGDAAPLVAGASSITGDQVTVIINGGTVGNIYTVNCLITTTEGLTDRRNFRIVIKNRTL
tara:strand:- start:165 stop:494 length:330 start_codon:yes stop_codon:yes gene_type:complete